MASTEAFRGELPQTEEDSLAVVVGTDRDRISLYQSGQAIRLDARQLAEFQKLLTKAGDAAALLPRKR